MSDLHPDTTLATLPNGVRVVALRLPHLQSASVSVFVRSGSAHESRPLNGVSHVIEHMMFKGTATRDCRRINLDAERLGAEVNAHTDKDHTAFHMRGLGRHAVLFVRMLGDIVRNASFPEDEFERERQVLLHEYTEDDEDPVSEAFRLFDRACWGWHPLAQPVIGSRGNIERFSRADLVGHVARQYSGTNLVVGAAGHVDPDEIVREVEAAFGSMAPGAPNLIAAPTWIGGLKTRQLPGSSQTHAVVGYPIAPLQHEDPASALAAAMFGEGMNSPLLDQLRERRGLVYHAACSADVVDQGGQFVIEVSTSPEQLDECLTQLMRLLAEQAAGVDAVDLERARNQLSVRRLRDDENAGRRLETAALDLLVRGALRPPGEWAGRLAAVTADEVRSVFQRLLQAGAAAALTGSVGRGVAARSRATLGL